MQYFQMKGKRKIQSPSDKEIIQTNLFMESIPASLTDVIKKQKSQKSIIKKQRAKDDTVPARTNKTKTSINQYLYKEKQKYFKEPNVQISSQEQSVRSLIQTHQFIGLTKIKDQKSLQNPSFNAHQSQTSLRQHGDNNFILRDIVKKYKIKAIVSNFIKKLKRTSVLSNPVEFRSPDDLEQGFLQITQGIQLPQFAQNIMSLLTIFYVIGLAIISSISLVFDKVQESSSVRVFSIFCTLFSIVQLILNLITVKYSSGKKLSRLIEIWTFLANRQLVVDILIVLILFGNMVIDSTVLIFLTLIILLKIPLCLDKMQKLQVTLIKNFYNEQYWSLVKILLVNFAFAHIIAILLAAMSYLNSNHNWMTVKNIDNSPWYEQYIWSYYWANTIMMTVGFGDLVATNYQQALCLVFIESFSCIALGYNINCVGGLIQRIRSQDEQRSKKTKIFKKLTDKNELPEQVSSKINNYIQQNAQLRKKFNFEEEKQFISSLPYEMKRNYLKESNKKIFENILFFKSFISKTLYNMAEKIQMRVSHPEEVIQRFDDDFNLIILKAGQMGFGCKRPGFQLCNFIMNKKSAVQSQNPQIMSLDFIEKKRPYYEIISMGYSIFFFLTYDQFVEILRETEMDFQFFCSMRDRIKNIPDEYEIFDCEMCDGRHLKASCPKLHFIPYHQTVIYKYLHQKKIGRNERKKRIRRNINFDKTFTTYNKSCTNIQKLQSLAVHMTNRRKRTLNLTVEELSSSDCEPQQLSLIQNQIKFITQKYALSSNQQIIKSEFSKLRKLELEEDQIWLIKSDYLADFNGYFPEDNPVNLSQKYHEFIPLLKSENISKSHTSMMLKVKMNTEKHLIKSISMQ